MMQKKKQHLADFFSYFAMFPLYSETQFGVQVRRHVMFQNIRRHSPVCKLEDQVQPSNWHVPPVRYESSDR